MSFVPITRKRAIDNAFWSKWWLFDQNHMKMEAFQSQSHEKGRFFNLRRYLCQTTLSRFCLVSVWDCWTLTFVSKPICEKSWLMDPANSWGSHALLVGNASIESISVWQQHERGTNPMHCLRSILFGIIPALSSEHCRGCAAGKKQPCTPTARQGGIAGNLDQLHLQDSNLFPSHPFQA